MMLATQLLAGGGSSPAQSIYVLIAVAIIGIIPGYLAYRISTQTRRDQRAQGDHSASVDLTKIGADILTKEVQRLGAERVAWESERAKWMDDKADFLQKVNYLTLQLEQANSYLYELVNQLRAAGVEPPPMPPTLRLIRAANRTTDEVTRQMNGGSL